MKNTSKLVLALTVIVSFAFIKPKHSEPKKINIVIDAGHGGTDFGATSDAITEKKIVEQVTKKIKSLNSNVVIHLTRNEDSFLSLNDRTAFINKLKPDLVLSLHVNTSLNNKTSGLEFYVAKETEFFEKIWNRMEKYLEATGDRPARNTEKSYIANEKFDDIFFTQAANPSEMVEALINAKLEMDKTKG